MPESAADGGAELAPRRSYQPTFAAGELAPALHWRSDLAKWRAGASQLQNFIVTAQGGVARRAGTQFVALARSDLPPGIRLIRFQFSTEQQYLLEVGEQYMRFITQGAYVMNGGVPYEISTPYAAPVLFQLRMVQSADVLTIVHPFYQPRQLKRLGALNWTLTALAIGTQLAAPTGLTATATFDTAVTGSPTPTDHTFTYAITASSFSTSDESQLSGSASCTNKDLGYYNQYGYRNQLAWSAVTGADFYTVYHKYQGTWSKIASTTDLALEDINYVPNTAAGPPSATNPFTGGNWPGTVGYFQERLVFGGSAPQPETIWMSKSGNYNNFDVADPVRDDDAITYTLAARQVNQVRHLLPLSDLIVMTSGGGWKVSATSGAITPGNIDVTPQSFVGASEVTPEVIGERILYVEAKGSSVREIGYQFVQNRYVSEDRSVFARHLLLGHSITSWAWAECPDKVLWAVREDGVLLSFTYLPEQEVYAWAQHRTSGLFRNVEVITEAADDGALEDVAYFIVERAGPGGVRPVIERMHSRRLGPGDGDVTKAWHVDCALRYSGAPATHISGLGHLPDGTAVDYLADGLPGSAVVTGGAFDLPAAASVVTAGLPAPAMVQTLPADSQRPGEDPWMGRLKHGFRARVAVANSAGLTATVDGGATVDLIDRSTDAEPQLAMFTGVLDARLGEGWTRDGRVSIVANTPLPATILGVGLEWQVGE